MPKLFSAVLCLSSFPQNWDPLLTAKLNDIKSRLLSRSLSKGACFEKLRSTCVFSIRANGTARLMCTRFYHENQSYWVLTSFLENHEYEKAPELKPGALKKLLERDHDFLVGQIQALPIETVGCDEPETSTMSQSDFSASPDHPKLIELDFYNHQWLSLTDEQQTVLHQATFPLVLQAQPGAGKTLLAVKALREQLREAMQSGSEYKSAYITSSPKLAHQTKINWMQSSCYHPADEQYTAFLSYADLMKQRYPQATQGCTEVAELQFTAWYEMHSKKEGLPLNQASAVYQEFRLISGYTQQDYLELGQRRCVFDPSERMKLWQAYWKYCSFLKKEQQIDWGFFPACAVTVDQHLYCLGGSINELIALDSCYDFLTIDETQLISLLQLRVLSAAVNARKKIFCLMDVDQGNDTFRKAIFLKEIWGLTDNQILQLRQGHRCPEKIAHLAAQVLAIRNHVCAGDVEGKGWARQVEVSSHPFQEKGIIQWVSLSHEQTRSQLCELTRSTESIVIASESALAEARSYFGNEAVIVTPKAAQGLEWKTVIAFRLFDEIQPYDDLLADYSPESPPRQSRPKSPNHKLTLGPAFNSVYIALTRATETLINVLSDDSISMHNSRNMRRILQQNNEELLLQPVRISSRNDWMEKTKELILRGNDELASQIVQQRFEMSLDAFKHQFLETVVMSVPCAVEPEPQNLSKCDASVQTDWSKISWTQLPQKRFSQLISQYLVSCKEKQFVELFQNPMDDGYCLLEHILKGLHTKEFIHALKSYLILDSGNSRKFIHALWKMRDSSDHPQFENDFGFAVLIRYDSGYKILHMLINSRLADENRFVKLWAKTMIPQMIGKILMRARTQHAKEYASQAILFNLLCSKHGVALLTELLDHQKGILDAFDPQIFIKKVNHSKFGTTSIAKLLVSTPQGETLLERYPQLLNYFSTPVGGTFFPLMVLSKRIYQAMLGYLENDSSLLGFITSEVLLQKTSALLNPRELANRKIDGNIPFILSFLGSDHELLKKCPRIVEELSPESMIEILPSELTGYAGMSLYSYFIANKTGLGLLIKYPHLSQNVNASFLLKQIHSVLQIKRRCSVFSLLCMTDDGCSILSALFLTHPDLIDAIDRAALFDMDSDSSKQIQKTCAFASLSNTTNGYKIIEMLIDRKSLRFFEDIPLAVWMSSTIQCENHQDLLDSCVFHNLIRGERYQQIFLKLLDINPRLASNIDKSTLCDALPPQNYTTMVLNSSLFFWLVRTQLSLAIWKKLFEADQEIVMRISSSALCSSLSDLELPQVQRCGSYNGLSAFYYLCSSGEGQAILLRMLKKRPELTAFICAKVLCSVVSAPGRGCSESPFFCLSLLESGLEILMLIFSHNQECCKNLPIGSLQQTQSIDWHGETASVSLDKVLFMTPRGRSILRKICEIHPDLEIEALVVCDPDDSLQWSPQKEHRRSPSP